MLRLGAPSNARTGCLLLGMGCARRSCDNGPQVAEGGYAQTLKRSTDMKDKTNIQNEEQTGRLQQPAVGGSLPISVLLAEMNELPKLKDFASRNGDAQGYARLCGQEVLLQRLIKRAARQ